MISRIALVFLVFGLTWSARAESGETTPIDLNLARQYFDELKTISDRDGGHLWGVPLYGPSMFVDPGSRYVVANQADKEGGLIASDGVYTGTLDPSINISNTATDWSGMKWTMVSWNAISQNDLYDRHRLLVHESWHRVQNEIGIPSVTSKNSYLDETEGRVRLLLEFRALSRALLAKDISEQRQAISDALNLQHYRQSLFPNNNESAFERHEGMAEYTGLKLCGLSDSVLAFVIAKKLQRGEDSEGLTNSFAYLTGPAYGLLLDRLIPDWREKVRNGADLPGLLAGAVDWKAPANEAQLKEAADAVGKKYDADKLTEDVTSKAKQQEETISVFRNRLKTEGRLLIPNDNLNFSFNPMEKLLSFDSTAVLYKTMRLTGDFGVLEATDGMLRTNNWQYFIAVAPAQTTGDTITWPGYKLQLQPGWHIMSGEQGTFIIEKE